jgi:hypothetical protein
MQQELAQLLGACHDRDIDALKLRLRMLVPEYHEPSTMAAEIPAPQGRVH